jgi:hypothetical protein
MNTLYKKIALVCLVSLTANQAAQAFQISDVLGWFKSNQKSVACVTVLAAMTAALCYFKYTKVAAAAAHKVQDAAANEVQNYSPFEDMIKKLRATQSSEPAKAKVRALEKTIQGVLNEFPELHNCDCHSYAYYKEHSKEFTGYCFYVRSIKDNIGRIEINVGGELRIKDIDHALFTILDNFNDDIILNGASNNEENNALLKENLKKIDGFVESVPGHSSSFYFRAYVQEEQPALLAGQDDSAPDDEE